MRLSLLLLSLLLLVGCQQQHKKENVPKLPNQYITVLGVAQDAGYPHIGCQKLCCEAYYSGDEQKKRVTSLGLVDHLNHTKYLFEATPDIATQLHDLNTLHLPKDNIIDGVFLTHAHIGHYTGLMYFGREAKGANNIPVYAMPKMRSFLENNAPWSQLVDLENIAIEPIEKEAVVYLNNRLKVSPFLVPHRDELSETVGYKIQGESKTALFIPDINKWELWSKNIITEVKKVDYAFLDATFFKDGEIPRPMNEVPHPFIEETVALFENESAALKSKVIFIHFNHSNPAILSDHKLKRILEAKGFQFAKEGAVYGL